MLIEQLSFVGRFDHIRCSLRLCNSRIVFFSPRIRKKEKVVSIKQNKFRTTHLKVAMAKSRQRFLCVGAVTVFLGLALFLFPPLEWNESADPKNSLTMPDDFSVSSPHQSHHRLFLLSHGVPERHRPGSSMSLDELWIHQSLQLSQSTSARNRTDRRLGCHRAGCGSARRCRQQMHTSHTSFRCGLPVC